MKHLGLAALFACSALAAQAREFNINCNSNLVVYWGQNSHGVTSPGENQLPLDEYCDKDSGDVLVLSFLSEFNADGLHPPGLNLASSCLTTFGNSTLLHCPNIGKAISKCQKKGKAVLLSLGGAAGAYGFADDMQAERYADQIWDMFLGGNSQTRPFDDAVLDGIDLDIEGGSSVGYVRFVQRLRERFIEAPGRRFYVSAAPQCAYPDFYAGPVLDNAYLDMVFVQFYNNYCGVDKPNWFNFEQWHEWATTISANKNVRVYLGVPGSAAAASTGYTSVDKLEELVNVTRKKFASFGGMMMWDASQADSNRVEDDATFVDLARKLLDSGRKCSDGSDNGSETTSASASSSTASDAQTSTEKDSKESSSSSLSCSTDSQHQTSTGNASASSSPKHHGTRTRLTTSTVVGENGTATIITHVELSEIVTGTHPNPDPSDAARFAQQHLNRVAVATADADTDADESSASTASTDEDSEATTSDEVGEQSATGTESSEDQTAIDGSIEDTPDEDSADSTTGDSAEEQIGSASDDADSTPEDSNETTTLETTKVLYTTATRTRKVHVITKHVTKRVRKSDHQNSDSLSEPSPVTTNKTISIVTPTFPLPIARCPRADQPCIGAGFACNGYEFGQCVNNRWLMRPCSTDRVTACFNAGPDLIACDFPKGRSLQVCDDILAPLPYGRLASNVLFLRASDQERALNTPVYPVPSSTASITTPIKKKKKDDDDDDDDTDEEDDDYVYNKYGEKKKNTSVSTTTDMELVKQSSGVNLIDDHNRREDPAMLMAKDPEAYYGPDGHVRVVGGNVVDDLRKHNSFGTSNEPYDENPPVDDPEEADEYSDGDEFMRKRDLGAWDEEETAASSVPSAPTTFPASMLMAEREEQTCKLGRRNVKDLTGESVSMAHLNEKPWRSQVEDFYATYALYAAFSGISNDLSRQQFERVILDHIDGDFIVPPMMPALEGHPMLARFTFVPIRGEDPDFMHHRTKDGMVEENVLVVVRMMTNIPIPKRWKIALPLPLNATMLHTSRGSFYAGDRVSADIKSMYSQRVAFYNENIRFNTNKRQTGPETQRLDDLAAGHSSNNTDLAVDDFSDGENFNSVKRSLISPAIIAQILHKKPGKPLPLELLDEPIPNDPAGRLYEIRSNPEREQEKSMALFFTIRVKTHATPGGHVVGALPHPLLSFITTY
ncbi:Chitinase 2 [Coemansia sp. RSA 2399]|nr:Chitinase 2 [Coemansia sp. RSA 2399]KAJ1908237.1 Chitinase 2 [Coemansia sp. IMI 209127]